jgi:hypothetical protein
MPLPIPEAIAGEFVSMTLRFVSFVSCGLLLAANAAAQGAPGEPAPAAPPAEAAPAAAAPEAAPAAPAEAAPAEAAPAPAPAEAAPPAAAPAPAPAETTPPEEKKDEEGNMGGILIGLKLSMLMVGEGEFEYKSTNPITGMETTQKSTIASRTDFQVTVPLNFGGSGLGFDLQPSIGFGDVTALGLYLGLAYHLEINPKTYVNFGLGPQVRYWLEDAVDIGADIMGRVPVGATYYAAPDLGLFAELGLAFGATGYKLKSNPAAAGLLPTDFNVGTTYAFDIGVGVRWP